MFALKPQKSIGHSAFWSITNQMAGQVLVLLVFLVTARFVDQDAFGVMATCLILVEFFKQVFLESMSVTFFAKKEPTAKEYNLGFWVIAIGGAISALAVYVLAVPASLLFDQAAIVPTMKWVALLLLTTGLFKMHEIWLIKNQRFKILAVRSMVSILVGGAVGVVMAIQGYGLIALIAQQLITSLLSAVWLWIGTPWKPSFNIERQDIKPIMRYTGHVSLAKLAGFANGQSEVFFSAYYLGAAATGVYNAGKRLISAVMMIVNGGISNVAFPALAETSDNAESFRRSFLKGISLITFLTAPVYAGIAVLADDIVFVLLGDKWLSAAPVLAVMCLFGFMASLDSAAASVLYIKNKPQWQLAITTINAIINIVALLVFAKYGLMALVLTLSIKRLILHPLNAYYSLRLLDIRAWSYIRSFYKSVFAALVMMGMIYFGNQILDLSGVLSIVVFVPFGMALYITVSYLIDRSFVKEIYQAGLYSLRTKA